MTTTNRGPRAKPASERGQGDGAHSGWQELRSRLGGIVDVLSHIGHADPIDGFEQVAQLIYLKLLDEQEPIDGSPIFSGMKARFRWSHFRQLPPRELHRFVKNHVLSYLGSLVNEAPAVADYYRDATLKIDDLDAFWQIFRLIDGIDFPSLKPDEMGRILEYLFAETKYAGEFRTPRHLRALMVFLVDPTVGETIYDPACGTGGFLTDAVSYVLAKASSAPREVPIYGQDWPTEENGPPLQTWKVEGGKLGIDRSQVGQLIHGNDISRRMIRIASLNLALQKIGSVDVRRASSLSNFGGLSPAEMERKYDVILCAPAFGDAPSYDEIRSDLPIVSTRRELLFLEVAMESLAPGGRCAIIVPENVLFSEGSTFVEVRKRLFSTCDVLAIISLPTAVFRPYSAVKTSILVFRRPTNGPPRVAHVWFYEIEHDGFDLNRAPQPEANDIPELQESWASFAASAHMHPPGPEFASGRRIEGTSRCWWAGRTAIEENRFDLSAQRYKPRFYDVAWESPEERFAELLEARASFGHKMDALSASLVGDALPRGWSEEVPHKKLEELVEIVQGKTPSTTTPSYWGDGFPWVSPKDMKRHVISDAQDHVTQSAVDNVPMTIVEPGAVLIVVRGMILVRSIPIAVTSERLVINQDIRALRPREGKGIDTWYLFAFLKSIEDLLLTRTQGTAHGSQSLPKQAILDLDVPVPSPRICAQIGRTMQSYVMLVETNEHLRGSVLGLFPVMLHAIFGR
jgi:type I restriction enzyme M protein